MREMTLIQKQHARSLRRSMTPSEKKLWAALRDRRYGSFKFRRQQPIGPYIVDLCCCESKVVLELDGDSHVGKEVYDARRVKWLENEGWKVLRFWDSEVFGNIDGIMQAIYAECSQRLPHPAQEVPASTLSLRERATEPAARV